jgi:hypothetical protein
MADMALGVHQGEAGVGPAHVADKAYILGFH